MDLLKSNAARSKLAILLLFCVMIMDLIFLFSNTLEYQLLVADFISEEAATANDTRQRIIGILYLLVYISSVVFFIRWFRRAYHNLHQRAEYLNYTENWASLAWFVPIISLFRPYKITQELFEQTEEYLSENIVGYKEKTSLNLVGIWWAFWIISNIFGNISFRTSQRAKTLEDFQNASLLNIFDDVLGIIAAIFAIIMIKEYAKIETLFFETNKKEEVPVTLLEEEI